MARVNLISGEKMKKQTLCLLLCVSFLAVSISPLRAEREADYIDHRIDPSWDVSAVRGDSYEVDFTTDEGTWMSVDISPDGRWVVFDMMGHVYRLRAEGGKAETLTQASGAALNYHPRISPDGQSIAFISDRGGQANLWVMDLDGGNPRPVFEDPVSRMTMPSWSPDGKYIYAVREFPTYAMHRRSARIWRFPVESSIEVPEEMVGAPSGSQAYWPSASADGQSLYFMSSTFAAAFSGVQKAQHIRRLDLKSGEVSVVTQPFGDRVYWRGTSASMAPEVSPDGRWLAFARRIPGGSIVYRGHEFMEKNALWLRDLHTGEERILADAITIDMQGAHGMKNLRIMPGYAWSKDSKSLVMWHEGKLRRIALDGEVTEIPFEARVRRKVSEQARWSGGIDTEKLSSRFLRWPSISASADKAVFDAVGGLWTADLGGAKSKAKPLVVWTPEKSYFMPEVSPDGQRVAFVSWNDDQLGEVLVCDLDDCQPQTVSIKNAQYLHPTWSPDSRHIYVLRSRDTDPERISDGAAYDFDLVELSSGAEKIIRAHVPPQPVQVGPDGKIFFLIREGDVPIQTFLVQGRTMPEASSLMVSLPEDGGSNLTKHAKFPAATWAMPSPDGQWVGYIEDHEAYVAPLKRSIASYAEGEENNWEGQELPTVFLRDNPLHQVAPVSFGGAEGARWSADGRLVYASGNKIHLYDPASGKKRSVEVELTLPKHGPEKDQTVALTNARIISLGKAGIVEKGSVVVRGSRLLCVGECDTSRADKTIDVAGKTVVPGFIDVHAHGAFLTGRSAIIPQRRSPQALYLSHGVTTMLDPSANNEEVFPMAEMIEAGRLVGPRTYSTGNALITRSPRTGPKDNREAEAMVRRLADAGARSIKVFLTPRRDQRQMLTDWARKLGLSATFEGADLYYNMASILDGQTGFEHPMHYIGLYKDAVEFFGRTRAVYSPTIVVASAGFWAEEYQSARTEIWTNEKFQRFLPWRQLLRHRDSPVRPLNMYSFPLFAEGVKDIRKAGGYGAIGGHGEMWGIDSHWEMWSYATAMKPIEVLTMATQDGARMIGLENELGSLDKGKVADLVILNSDPLSDIRNTTDIAYVMKGGVLYEGDTLDQKWPVEQAYGTPSWFNEAIFNMSHPSHTQ
jgi:Tol biopolymer transport system component